MLNLASSIRSLKLSYELGAKVLPPVQITFLRETSEEELRNLRDTAEILRVLAKSGPVTFSTESESGTVFLFRLSKCIGIL